MTLFFLDTPNSRPLPPTDPVREAVLAALDARGGEATCGDLCRDLDRVAGTIRNALDKLIAQGRVQRLHGKPPRFRVWRVAA